MVDSDEDSYRAIPPGIIRKIALNEYNICSLVRNLVRQYFLRASGAIMLRALPVLVPGAARIIYSDGAAIANIASSKPTENKRTFCLRRSRIRLILIKTKRSVLPRPPGLSVFSFLHVKTV